MQLKSSMFQVNEVITTNNIITYSIAAGATIFVCYDIYNNLSLSFINYLY